MFRAKESQLEAYRREIMAGKKALTGALEARAGGPKALLGTERAEAELRRRRAMCSLPASPPAQPGQRASGPGPT